MPGPQKEFDAQFHVRCEAWLKEAMEADAKRMGVSTNELVRMAMRLWLAKRESFAGKSPWEKEGPETAP